MEVLDLQLQIGQRHGELTVFMQSPTQNDSFQVAFPLKQSNGNRNGAANSRDTTQVNTVVTADAVSNFGTGLHQPLVNGWLTGMIFFVSH